MMRKGWHIARLALMTLGLSLVFSQAVAQIIRLDPPSDSAPDPDAGADPSLADSPSWATEGRQGSGLALEALRAATAAREELLPLRPEGLGASHGTRARLAGEAASSRFSIFLPQSPGATELELAHRTGIDALPERSSLRVRVNGTDLGAIQPSSFEDFAIARFAVPDGVMAPGPNLVEISARHTHRIACGVDASFALWTEIDLARSGVRTAADRFTLGPEGFIAAVAAQAARGAPITFHRPDPEVSMVDAAPFIARAAMALGGTPPEIVSAPYWFLEGERPQLARITAFPPGEGPESPRFRRGGDGAIVLLLDQSDNYEEVLELLFSPAPAMVQPGPVLLEPGEAREFSRLGIAAMQGEGRYLQLTVDFALPWDWILLASQKARLDLDYRFSDGLPEGALLQVKLNGTTVRLLPLDRDGGQAQPTLPISFAANLLNPGINQLAFEALVPGDPPDMACPPMDGPILEVSETSRLYVPSAPRMVQPSVDRTLASVPPSNIALTPNAAARLPPGLVPQLAAALLVAPEETGPGEDDAQLRVGVLSDLEQMPTEWSRSAIRALFQTLSVDIFQPETATPDSTPWQTVSGPVGALSQLGLNRIASLPGRAFDWSVALVRGPTPSLEDWLADRDAQMALLQPDTGAPHEIWLILSPSIDLSQAVAALAASRLNHDGPRGQVALYTIDRGWTNWISRNRPLSLHEAPRFSNFRAIMGNFATTAPLPFIGALLGLTLLSVVVALTLLLLTRRSSQ